MDVPADPGKAESQLRELLALARVEKLPVSIAGARHTMGKGQRQYSDKLLEELGRLLCPMTTPAATALDGVFSRQGIGSGHRSNETKS